MYIKSINRKCTCRVRKRLRAMGKHGKDLNHENQMNEVLISELMSK